MNIWNITHIKLLAAAMVMIILAGYGCGDKTPSRPVKKVAPPKAIQPVPAPAASDTDAALQDMAAHEGYIYQQRDRRDPFVPLIVPTKKLVGKADRKIGTLESYDISEFKLSAIATKGTEYFALLVTPDNRSFTVNKGSVIGLSKGKVNQILSDKVILVEYSKDFRGEFKERQLILEFRKGETK
jgi:Tfp pilus assembly protein PilP